MTEVTVLFSGEDIGADYLDSIDLVENKKAAKYFMKLYKLELESFKTVVHKLYSKNLDKNDPGSDSDSDTDSESGETVKPGTELFVVTPYEEEETKEGDELEWDSVIKVFENKADAEKYSDEQKEKHKFEFRIIEKSVLGYNAVKDAYETSKKEKKEKKEKKKAETGESSRSSKVSKESSKEHKEHKEHKDHKEKEKDHKEKEKEHKEKEKHSKSSSKGEGDLPKHSHHSSSKK